MNIFFLNPEYKIKGETNISPELLAAIFARFSRKGEGLEGIISDLEKTPRDKFEDRIWSFLDYGHASISELTGVIPMGADKVSMLVPYLAFFVQPKQSGQETSTRYVEFKKEGLAEPRDFGIPERFHQEWYELMLEAFEIHQELTKRLDLLGKEKPELARIPDDASSKERERMIRNFGFDRSRYFLPMSSLTNFGLEMSGREWAQTLQYLDSFNFPEAREFSFLVRENLKAILPRLLKHSFPSDRTLSFASDFLERGAEYLREHGINSENLEDEVVVNVYQPPRSPFIHPKLTNEEIVDLSFRGKKNRYDFAKGLPEKIFVNVQWNNIALAEARDLNRHRPCKKDTLLAPVGFYLPEISVEEMKRDSLWERSRKFLERRNYLMRNILSSENPSSYIGCLLLGDQTPFEISTTSDHFAYISELRTGRGAHFRYAEHLRKAYEQLKEIRPDIAKHIKLGLAEPE
ncbi:MAG: FAD-dependent thymidylate synthase [Candidatus Pacearchaeota archaeon]